MGKEWFRHWFDENYKLLYQHRDMEDALCQFKLIIREISPQKNWKILDLACGEGRYSELFREQGYNITGIDLSETLINSGRKKFPELRLLKCDMRDIPGDFDMILSLFTSFGYFEEEKEDRKVLSEVYRSLNSGGIFWFDFFNSEYVLTTVSEAKTEKFLNGVYITEEKKIVGNRINKTICFSGDSGYKEYNESVRLYSRDELARLLHEHGFSINNVFGSYHGSEFSLNSERAIFYCRKAR